MTPVRSISAFVGLLCLLSLWLAGAGCGGKQIDIPSAEAVPALQAHAPSEYVLRAGDELEIKFFLNPELNERVTIRPDGKLSLQLVEEIDAAGLTPAQLDALLTQRYARELREPEVAVIVRSFASQKVYVGGQVGAPGMLDLTAAMTPLEAVFKAGGFKDEAQPAETLLIRRGPDRQPVVAKIDLATLLANGQGAANLLLRPADIIYVPKSPIAKANQFVRQYIEQLLLFRGFYMSFDYQLYKIND